MINLQKCTYICITW